MSSRKLSRRQFLKASVLAGTGAAMAGCAGFPTIVPRGVLGGKGYRPPSERLNIAFVGVAGMGAGDVEGMKDENMIAFADVDWKRAERTFAKYPDVPRYRDFREMLEEKGDEIDAVCVSTPDHTHAVAAMAAIRLNKHVYVQKPLAHSIYECRLLRDEAKKRGLVTQMGIQGHAGEGARLIYEWIAQDAIGDVKEVHYWTNRPIWAQGIPRPKEVDEIPETMSWDLWLGPAPDRPYNSRYAPFSWRGWQDFGTGALGDMGCHIMDAGFWALDLASAERIHAHAISSPTNDETYPNWAIIFYHVSFPGNRPDLKIVWHDGGRMPPRPERLEADRRWSRGGGQIFYGTKGALLSSDSYGGSPRLIPETDMQSFIRDKNPKKFIPRIEGGHRQEWFRAIRGEGPTPGANFDYSAALSEFVLIGNLALNLRQEIEYDCKQARIVNIPDAEKLVHPPMRDGWAI